jgi:tetratricopeptide (TPR) repeat protein
MNELTLLRQLAENQQYPSLLELAQSLWHESRNPAILPLLATANAHMGLKGNTDALYQQSLECFDELDADARCDLAAVLIILHRMDDAIKMLSDILVEHAEHPLVLARLAYCHLAAGRLTEAQQLFQKSLSISPKRLAVHRNLVAVYIAQNELIQAQHQLDSAIDVLENNASLSEDVYQQYWVQLNTIQLTLWVAQNLFAPAEEWLTELAAQQQAGDCEEALLVQCIKSYSQALAEKDFHQQATDILREYLRQYNDNTELCMALAELSQVQGHVMQAVNYLQKALKKDEKNSALWVQLSSACLHRFDKKSRKAAERAVSLTHALAASEQQPLAQIKMKQAQANNALAQVESQEQNFERSEQLYRDILAEHSHFLPALQGLGQQQMQQGHIDEALALFERVKAIDPLKGYSALINARRFPEEEETLEKMAIAANQPSMEGPLRAGILFQLAAAWEKRKDYGKAFSFAEQANNASNKFLPYNAQKHRDDCARVRACFNKELYQHRPYCGVDSTTPVYVLGMPRSGTTLVEQILSGHSDIFGAGELGIIPQVIQGMNRWERHTGSGRKYPDCIDDLNAYTTEGIANNALKELQELATDAKPDAHYVVDKLPHNFENIGLIKFLFPNAKIISVRRDPRDIAVSNYFTDYQAKHGGMGFAYDLQSIGEQLADHNLLMHHWQQTFPGEILELNYEDVVDDLEGSARKMLDYIGVAWQPEVLKFNELERTVKTASVWQVRQPIYKTSKAKWKRYETNIAPLIKGTNTKILASPMTDLFALPEPGFLTDGVAFYKEGKLDEAEMCFKKMLHHNLEHAACNYMVGLIYLTKNHPKEGISHVEIAVERCPWQKEWRKNLLKAYKQEGDNDKIVAFKAKYSAIPANQSSSKANSVSPLDADDVDHVFSDNALTSSAFTANNKWD